jgi:hypothetical protein
MTAAEMGVKVWDPICLVHNILSVSVGVYTVLSWQKPPSDTCVSVSDETALVIFLQAAHSLSDFIVFLPQMVAEPVFLFHHSILLFVSLVLPYCHGCFYAVIAFGIAELGSAAIAADAEWRKAGGQSSGLTRLLIFGLSRLVNLVLLYQIWLVTPMLHEFILSDGSDGSLVFKVNIPICMLTSIGGSITMLCVNGMTFWWMWISYLKQRDKRKGKSE